MATAEDTLVSKLEWARKAGGSERQLDDAAGILAGVRRVGSIVPTSRDGPRRSASLDLWHVLLAGVRRRPRAES